MIRFDLFFVVSRELSTELSWGCREEERRVMSFMEGQGVDGHVGDDFCVVLCLSSSTLV